MNVESSGIRTIVLLATLGACGETSGDVLEPDPGSRLPAVMKTVTSDAAGGNDGATAPAATDMDAGAIDSAPGPPGTVADSAPSAATDAPFVTQLIDAACTGSFQSDSANCGRCGHGCFGAPCVSGQCQPVLLATGQEPFSVVIDDERVYWSSSDTDPGTVRSVAKDGSQPVTIATNMHRPQGVAVDGTNVFWNETAPPGRMFKANKDGSNPVLLSQTNAYGPQGVAVDGDWVYYLDLYRVGGVVKVPRAGVPDAGLPITVSAPWPNVWAIAEDATNIYWTTRGTCCGSAQADAAVIPGRIYSVPKSGGAAATVIADGQVGPVFVTVDTTAVYWTDQAANTVMRLPFGAQVPSTLASGEQPYGIAVDQTDLYFSTLGTDHMDGTLVRLRKDGSGAPTVLATGLSWPSQIALDDQAVYWGNTHGGTLMKLAK